MEFLEKHYKVTMTKPPSRDWRMLPDLIFSDIMMKIVLENVGSLHRCRQVCKTWNEKIMHNIWENPSKKAIIKTRIGEIWGTANKTLPSREDVSHAKWLGINEVKNIYFVICFLFFRS